MLIKYFYDFSSIITFHHPLKRYQLNQKQLDKTSDDELPIFAVMFEHLPYAEYLVSIQVWIHLIMAYFAVS